MVYTYIPNSSDFIRPKYPEVSTGTIPIATQNNIDPIATQHIAQRKSLDDEEVQLYNKYQIFEQTLRSQVNYEVPAEYLVALRNADTNIINDYISDIIAYL